MILDFDMTIAIAISVLVMFNISQYVKRMARRKQLRERRSRSYNAWQRSRQLH